ncbi:MAG TPA: hypothetical protein VM223_15335 [Planctomycetota bacterium]|nr:hypothetical protein [Planctomycetota bacterium]
MKQTTWRIREPFDVAWDREYVWLDLPRAGRNLRSVKTLTDGSRLFSAQYDPERNALVACVDVAAGADISLEPSVKSPPDTALAVQARPGVHVFANRTCSVKLAAEANVIDAGDRWIVTGPIVSVTGPDGIGRCGSRIVVNKSRFFPFDRESIGRVDPENVAREDEPPRIDISVASAGPVFADYRCKLTMFDGSAYTFSARLYAEYPVLFVDEATTLGRDGAFELSISAHGNPRGLPYDTYFFGGTEGRQRQSQVPIPPYPYRLGSLTPHYTQSHTAYAWMGFMQSDRPQGSFRGICDTGLEPYRDVLVVMGHKPWEWEYPADSTLQFECGEGRMVTARGGLQRGTRSWCLFVLDRAEASRVHRFQHGGETREVPVLCLWHRKLNDLPFDWVRRLDLDSGALAPGDFPLSVLTKNEHEIRRSRTFPKIAELLAEKTSERRTAALYARWVMEGDTTAARLLADAVIAEMEGKLALALGSGFLADAICAVANRGLGPDAVYYEACVAAGVLTDAESERLRRIFLFFAYATAEDALFPSHQNYWPPDHPRSIRNWATIEQYSDVFGTPNFQTDVYYNLGLFGAVFRRHPKSREWMDEATRQLDVQLTFHFHPGGVYEESLGYFSHLFHNMLHLASVLRRQGIRDFYSDERFQNAMNCFVDYLGAPRRATVEGIVHPQGKTEPGPTRFWPAIGDTGHNCAEARLLPLVAHAAWEVREHNRRLSDRLLAAWNECGRPLWGVHMPSFEFLYIQDLDPKARDLKLQSRNFANVGPVLRADVGLPSETSIFVRSGRATHHWGFDHGHFSVTTRGSLLIPDFGYHGTTEATGGSFVHGSATQVHNVVTFGPDWNGGTGMERRGAERAVMLGGDFDYVVCDLSMNNVRHNNWRNIVHIVPVEYFRHILFAHNRYVFVWDRIEFSVYRSQLRINCLSKSVAVKGGRARFTGLDGVDLIVNVIGPARPAFHEGMVGPMRYLLCENDCQRDYVWVCQPIGKGEREFAVTASPNLVRIKGRDVHGAEFEDHIVYAKGDFGAAVQVNGRERRLDGRLAIIHREGSRERVKLLDARSV